MIPMLEQAELNILTSAAHSLAALLNHGGVLLFNSILHRLKEHQTKFAPACRHQRQMVL